MGLLYRLRMYLLNPVSSNLVPKINFLVGALILAAWKITG